MTDWEKKLAEYNRHWGAFGSLGPPSALPLGAHHGTARRWPEFQRLCEMAERRRLEVGIGATAPVSTVEGSERRNLRELVIRAAGTVVAVEVIKDGDIDTAARRLQPLVASS